MPNCNTNELAKLFDLCALIYRQIDMDSIEVKPQSTLRNMISDNRGKKVDQDDGDFGNLINEISEFDRQVLEASLKWIREQLGWSESDLKIVYNPKTKTAFIAAKDLAKLNEFVTNHHDNSFKISIHSQLNKAAFYVTDTFEKSNLSPKGLAVLQDYYAKKDGVRNDTFIGDSLELYKAFDALADAKDGTAINILFRCGSHWIPLRCEKKNGQYYFMEMDSLGTLNDAKINDKTDVSRTYIYEALAKSKLKSQGSKVHILRARNLRQVGPNNCAFFSLKDARKMQRDPNLFSEISAHVINATKQTTKEGYSYAEYLTPIEYVGTTQQPKTINLYVDKYNALKPGGKSVTREEVLELSLGRKRDNPEKSRVKVTGTEADQAYLEFEDKKERANLTIPYFKDKYMSNVVDKKVKNASLDELSSIVDRYNINKITPSRLNEIADHPVNVNKISDDKENIIEVPVKVQEEPQAQEIIEQLQLIQVVPQEITPPKPPVQKVPEIKPEVKPVVKSQVKPTKSVSKIVSKVQEKIEEVDFPKFTTFSKMPILKKYANKEQIANQAGKLLYKLNDGRIFWKALKGNRKSVAVEEGREVAGAWIANHITNGAVPRSHIREVDTKLGIAQEYVDIETFTVDSVKRLNKDQVTQILIHLIADKSVSNYDAHLENYGLNKDGKVIGIDKGEAFRFFQRNKVGFKTPLAGAGHDSDEINLDQYGKADINFYKQVFELVKQGKLEVDFDDPRVTEALKRCTDLSLEDVKQMYSGYAELQFKLPAKREEFYKEVHARLQNMPNAIANFRAKVQIGYEQQPQKVELTEQPEMVAVTVPKVVVAKSDPDQRSKPPEVKPDPIVSAPVVKPQSEVKPEPIVLSPSINKPQSVKPATIKPPVVKPQQEKPPVVKPQQEKPLVVKPQAVKPHAPSRPVYTELESKQAANFNKVLNMFGRGEAEIVKKINENYHHEKSKGRGFFSKRHAAPTDIVQKRTMQITDLAMIIGDLQQNKKLTSHEKGILLQGALQVIIDNIARTEINSPSKSSLSKMCHKLIDSLHKDKIGIDSTQAKILYNIYRSTNDNPEEKFREAARAGKLQQRRNQGK